MEFVGIIFRLLLACGACGFAFVLLTFPSAEGLRHAAGMFAYLSALLLIVGGGLLLPLPKGGWDDDLKAGFGGLLVGLGVLVLVV